MAFGGVSADKCRPIVLFMGRHFNWQPSEIDDMEVEELLASYRAALDMLKAERE